MPEADALGIARESLVALSAALGGRETQALERALRMAARVYEPAAVEEVLLQAHLFVGFPLALEALLRWREVSGRAEPAAAAEGRARFEERGEKVCRTVYGANYEKLRANIARLHPDLDEWMVTAGYGRVIGRPGLDLATREMCIAALLAVWNSPRQLHSHLRGALNAGASRAEVGQVVEVACRHLPPERAAEVRGLWGRVAGGREGVRDGAPDATNRPQGG
jgi:4-carboxymuconolactone decarboxylase